MRIFSNREQTAPCDPGVFLCFKAVKSRLEFLEAAVWEREERKRDGEWGERGRGSQEREGRGAERCAPYGKHSQWGPLISFSQSFFVQGPRGHGQACLAVPRGDVGTARHSGSQCPGHYLPQSC